MDNKKYRLSAEMSLAVPVDDADRLLSLGDGSAALLYLYALRRGGAFSPEGAARELRRTEKEITDSMEALRRGGLLSDVSSPFAAPRGEMPEYPAEDIIRRSRESGEFQAIVEETQRVVGKTLSTTDIKILFAIYDNLGLPAEVIFLLEHFCEQEAQSSRGPGAKPSMRAIENEATRWFNREILTLERAEEYLKRRRELSEDMNVIKRTLQISGRALTQTEKKYIESWLDMGFSHEAVALAYDRTIIKTGTLQWKYMNSILKSWHEKGLHTPEEIEAGDGKTPSPGKTAAPKPSSENGRVAPDSERIRRIMEKL